MKHGRNNYQVQECRAAWRAKTPPFPSNANQEPVRKKRKFNKRHLKITKHGSEEDLGNK